MTAVLAWIGAACLYWCWRLNRKERRRAELSQLQATQAWQEVFLLAQATTETALTTAQQHAEIEQLGSDALDTLARAQEYTVPT